MPESTVSSIGPSQQEKTRPETGLGFFIPCLNEGRSIGGVVAAIRRRFPAAPVVVVDDGSTDDTQRQALEAGAYCVRLASNMGIATASMVGMACCVELGCQAIVRLDGDGQHVVADVDSLIQAWRQTGADLVTGSRYLRGESYTSPLRQLGIAVLRILFRWLYGARVTDPTSGLRLYTSATAKWFLRRHYPVDYPEAEELADLCLSGQFKIGEAVISANPRLEGTSSITPLRSGYFMFKVCGSLLLRRVLVLWS
jgi:glycosyltransferase involved in cell wall biosynthesis